LWLNNNDFTLLIGYCPLVKRHQRRLPLRHTPASLARFLLRRHMAQQLLTQHRQNLLIEQAVDVTGAGIRQQAGGGQRVEQALSMCVVRP
jgi:hypothetical protein